LTLTREPSAFLVQKTNGGRDAFIKELMRRSAQFLVETGEKDLNQSHF
jgi:hypothetical protein